VEKDTCVAVRKDTCIEWKKTLVYHYQWKKMCISENRCICGKRLLSCISV